MKTRVIALSFALSGCGQSYHIDTTAFPGVTDVDTPSDNPLAPIDAACAVSQKQTVVFPAKNAPLPSTLPLECHSGFELNNLVMKSYTLHSTGARAGLQLEIDLATYVAPDAIRIVAVAADGQEQVLLDTCRMQTAHYSDPTHGSKRPPEDSIRDYRVNLPEGTQDLRFDFTKAVSPTYIQVLGLCDFELVAPDTIKTAAQWRKK